jgi:LmbE family N-acetylglucosaminyl deacetylase
VTPPTALFISPHLDDVAFSCAGTVAALKSAGWRTILATVFTRSVRNPTGFALACQTDKGLSPDIDYMALRRDEDAAFAQTLSIDEVHWLDLPEAPHRGYHSAAALFARLHPDDDIWRDAAARIATLADATGPRLVFAPQSLGNHVDHRQTVRAVIDMARPTVWYRDLPYAIRAPDEPPPPDLPDGLSSLAVPIGAHLTLKAAGACCYTTQLSFQFGGIDRVASVLTDFAAEEAVRAGAPGHVERVLACPSAAEHLAAYDLIG